MNQSRFKYILESFEFECQEILYDLEDDLNNIEIDLFEHDSHDVPLMEHRGKPDPAKVRERQQAHKRGIERHKNALQRENQAKRNKKSKQERKQELTNKLNKLETAEVKKGHELVKIDKKQNPGLVHVPETKEEAKKQVSTLSNSLANNNKKLNNKLRKFVNSAPSDKAKQTAVEFKKYLEKLNKNDAKFGASDAISKLSPQERKRRKERELKDLRKKYEGKLSDKERSWFREHSEDICNTTAAAADNFFDLCGIKTIYDDVWSAINYVTGGAASKITTKTKQKLFGK